MATVGLPLALQRGLSRGICTVFWVRGWNLDVWSWARIWTLLLAQAPPPGHPLSCTDNSGLEDMRKWWGSPGSGLQGLISGVWAGVKCSGTSHPKETTPCLARFPHSTLSCLYSLALVNSAAEHGQIFLWNLDLNSNVFLIQEWDCWV